MNLIKKTVPGILLLLLVSSSVFAQKTKHPKVKADTVLKAVKEIHWVQGKEPDFEDSVRKYKKPAFIYIYIDGWEDVAKFNQNVLADTNIINFVDSNFMAYRVNMEFDSHNAIKFAIDGVPDIVLFDKNAAPMAILKGYQEPKEFRKFLKQRLKK
jgi:thioredoxin-related protein